MASLADLAEEIHDFIESQLPTLKSGFTYSSITDLALFLTLDPMTKLEQQQIGVYVAPVTSEYNVGESNRRVKIISLTKAPRVAVFIFTICVTTSQMDIGEWAEVKEILNFRELLEKAIATQDWGANITDIAAEPPMETTLKKSSFLSITEFVFGNQSC